MLEMCFLQKPVFTGYSDADIRASVDAIFETNANTTPYSPGLLQLIKNLLTPRSEEEDKRTFFGNETLAQIIMEDIKKKFPADDDSSTADHVSGTKTQPKHLNWTEYDTFTFAANKSSPANQVAPVVAVANNEYKLPGIFPLIRSPRIL